MIDRSATPTESDVAPEVVAPVATARSGTSSRIATWWNAPKYIHPMRAKAPIDAPGVADRPHGEREELSDPRDGEEREEPSGGRDRPSGQRRRPVARRGHDRAACTSSATSAGVRPTCTPAPSSASAFACAVPLEPVMMAPACPMRLPGGAVNPAM